MELSIYLPANMFKCWTVLGELSICGVRILDSIQGMVLREWTRTIIVQGVQILNNKTKWMNKYAVNMCF